MRPTAGFTVFFVVLLMLGSTIPIRAEDPPEPPRWRPASSQGLSVEVLGTDAWKHRQDMPVLFRLPAPGADGVQEVVPVAGLYQHETTLCLVFRWAGEAPSETEATDVNLAFDPVYLFLIGMPMLVDPASGERTPLDYRFDDEKILFDHVRMDARPRYIEMHVCSRKLRNRGEMSIEDKLKQARTIRRIRARTASWSPLAPGQIIAQETLKPIVCHAGYDAHGSKRAVVWANGGKLTGTFELVDALRNRQHPAPQPVVFAGDLEEAGFHVWGGNGYVADFSEYVKPGLYYVRLRVGETKEVLESNVFPIVDGLYLDLAKKAADWFTYQRCGTAVEGFHAACHTEDAIIKTDGTRVDVTGGWHDAGDYGKWIWGGSTGLLGLTAFQDEFATELDATSEGMPRYVAEAAWEARYLCKTYWDGAFHAAFTPDFEDVCTWLGAPDQEPPRVVREEDCIEMNYGITRDPATCLTGAALARAGRLLLPHDEDLARRCLSVARDVYDRCTELERSHREEDGPLTGYLYYIQSGLLFIDLELHRITGEEVYLQDAQRRVRTILDLQDVDGSFFVDRERTSKTLNVGRHLCALYEFLRMYPETDLGPEIRQAFGKWAEAVGRMGGLSPFEQIGGRTEDGTLRNIKPRTNNGRFAELAWGLATAARLLKEPRYLRMAERQLQWILGFNPADVSMMAGVGSGPGCYHTRYCFMEGCEDGVLPGGVTLGIVPGTGSTIELGDTDTKNWVIADVPVDYPVIDTDPWGWTYAYQTSEYALAKGAFVVRAAGQIEKAIRELK